MTREELRQVIVSDLQRVEPSTLAREVGTELDRFGEVPVRQYLPVLVAKKVHDRHRAKGWHQ